MKTLIIHPQDNSTTFLEVVYANIENKTVITGGVSKAELIQLIEEHDRIMMMGHGSPWGLFAVGQFKGEGYSGYIIEDSLVELLMTKKDNVYIWCNADQFVNRYGLTGFYSGMFISEVGEATYCGLPGMSQEVVDESNYGFVNIVSKYVNEQTENLYENVHKEYGILAEENPVAFYNYNRLYKHI
jgi:hypothetical protein